MMSWTVFTITAEFWEGELCSEPAFRSGAPVGGNRVGKWMNNQEW